MIRRNYYIVNQKKKEIKKKKKNSEKKLLVSVLSSISAEKMLMNILQIFMLNMTVKYPMYDWLLIFSNKW